MMKKILVPYHEEGAARAALKFAVVLAKRLEGYIEGLLVFGEHMLTFVPWIDRRSSSSRKKGDHPHESDRL